MLWRCELKKILLTHKGILILTVCLLLKILFLWAFPEQKDSRIVLSQKQYDKYLAQLYGENTPEKSDWILEEYRTCKELVDAYDSMQQRYTQGELTEEEWTAFREAEEQAELHINSAKIFAEKAEQFLEQPEDLPPAHYIYEYGWQTIFVLRQFPDVFLLFGLLLLAAQSFPAEAAGGMLPVLLAARDGRRKLFRAKLLALLTVGVGMAAIAAGAEAGVFALRGWLADSGAPLYSVTRMTGCALELSLAQGYALSVAVSSASAVFLALLVYGLSLWIRSAVNLLFLGVSLGVVPMLLPESAALFTHGGLLSGTRMLCGWSESGSSLAVALVVITLVTALSLIFAARRQQRGL